jgi:hypothetical protein
MPADNISSVRKWICRIAVCLLALLALAAIDILISLAT